MDTDLETLKTQEKFDETMTSNESMRVQMVDPNSIHSSLFDDSVNTIATEEEDKSLRASIEAKGVQIPITVGRIGGKGAYHVVKGTRRYRFAIELKLQKIPVEYKEYVTIDAMKQDAIEDNLERRQYSTAALAKQGFVLWLASESPEARKELAARGLTPRKHAAISSGVSEGSLANFRAIQDSGNAELISKMEAGKISIAAAYNQMKRPFCPATPNYGKYSRQPVIRS